MWGLGNFESNEFFIPENDNPPSWEGLVAFLVAALCIWLLRLLRRNDQPGVTILDTLWILIPFVGCALIAMLGFLAYGSISGLNYFFLAGIGYLIYVIVINVILLILLRNVRKPGGVRRCLLGLTGAMFCLSLLCYGMSYAYYLPYSYPEPIRSQLRMLRRLIEVERAEDQGNAKMIPLSEARLTYKNEEVIPDSIRESGQFGDYQYTVHFNTPREGLLTIDAVPTKSKERLPSFHAFPINPDALDEEHGYVYYCITLARRNGEPATEKDPHFHRRGLIKVLLDRWQSSP